jgi:DNA-directed RNA polymerase specialized sigma24 family protein
VNTVGVRDLVMKAKSGDQDAWDELFLWAKPFLLNRAAKLLLPQWPGESVSQVLGLVWQRGRRGIVEFRGGTADDEADKADETAARQILAWLGQIAHRAIITHVLKPILRDPPIGPRNAGNPDNGRLEANGIPPIDDSPSVRTQFVKQEDLARLQQALGTFEEEDRRLILKIYSGEQSIRALAKSMNCPERALRDRRDKLLKRLRKLMKEEAP